MRRVRCGVYFFDIGTAGTTSLVLQTLLLPLALAPGASSVTIRGGTHVPWSPCYHYLEWQWLPYLAQAGYRVESTLERAGFYPPGGGLVHVNISPSQHLSALRITKRGRLVRIRGLSGVGRLPLSIAERQRLQALEKLNDLEVPVEIEVKALSAASPGTFLVLQAEFEGSRCCAFALGERHKLAEWVADEAVEELRADLASGGAIDAWLGDQLLLPLSFVPGKSEFSVCRISQHLRTNAELLGYFLPVSVDMGDETDRPGIVRIEGISAPVIASF